MTRTAIDRGLATIRIGKLAVAVDVATITGFVDDAHARADVDLGDVLGVAETDSVSEGGRHLVRLRHASGDLVLAVPGTIRIDGEGDVDDHHASDRRCHRPRFVAGAFRKCCLRGVFRRGSELIYLVDVDALAARTPPTTKEDTACESA
jgi:hypothetical protein